MSFRAAVISTLAAVALAGNVHDRSYYLPKFYSWLSQHKVAIDTGDQFSHFLQNFANNEDIINTHNAKPNGSYTLGHNQFSHLSLDEWRAYVNLGLKKPQEVEPPLYTLQASGKANAASIDWTTQGAVTDVKDQGQCGSCWSFSSTGALEGRYQVATGSLVSLSEQNLVDCDLITNGGSDMGCHGGLMDSAFAWTVKNGGLCTEAAYPYVSGTTLKAGDCVQSSCTKYAAPKGYVDVAANSDDAMVTALNGGPVSVAIEADQSSFQLYKSGVFDGVCGTSLDHGVLAVGYGTDGKDYYKVKNSWGASWGEAGYIRMVKGAGVQEGGQCGMLMQASFPTFN